MLGRKKDVKNIWSKKIINDHKGMTPTMIALGTKVYDELVEELAKYLTENIKKHFIE